ncbi:ADP-ribosylation factor-like protein 6-interacting protein 6 [Cololabis saira]|uniref:ADP-ribosylation factor-like protein 6-interacting protein 6 n=1 Tax=Cololabis saira TaxID=129043 RepID=UPI002AD43359|nr:ADP-ribosylation factor-like protein 6-interacting protein 6 [Cololabis saira]
MRSSDVQMIMLSTPPGNLVSGEEGRTGRPGPGTGSGSGSGSRPGIAVLASVLGSAVAVAALGCVCALAYPILKELRAETVKREDGTEERMLGSWSIWMLAALGGFICSMSSWTLVHLDSDQPGTELPASPALPGFRDGSGGAVSLNAGVAALNGVVAALTVIWSLS